MSTFTEMVSHIHSTVMRVDNANLDFSDSKDPRNLDPDDEGLDELSMAARQLEEAAHGLQNSVSDERRRRSRVLDSMTPLEFQTWEKQLEIEVARNS